MNNKILLANFEIAEALQGLKTFSPIDGSLICVLAEDDLAAINTKIQKAIIAQKFWQKLGLNSKVEILNRFIATVESNKSFLSELITLDAGKTKDEAAGEVSNFTVTFKEMAALALNRYEAEVKQHDAYLNKTNNLRIKKLSPVGVGGVITSYNFPLGVASWSLAPMLLAGNAAIWKPSEKTPLAALAIKNLFDKSAGEVKDLLQLVIGGKQAGEVLVMHAGVNVISATGSVAMGEAIIKTLDTKPSNKASPILELGGNNGVLISQKNSPELLEKVIDGITHSFLAGGGQKCTNTRRVFVEQTIYDGFVKALKNKIKNFIESGNVKSPLDGVSSKYGYAPLIDKGAYENYQATIKQAIAEGGELLFGERVLADIFSDAYYLNPAIMLMPNQTPIMFKECFAPLLFITKYNSFDEAIELVIKPENAGLVNGIYSQSKKEIEQFEMINATNAGHIAENMPTGTGTPAHRLGFGGKRKSGSGIILDWEGDPFAPFSTTAETLRAVRNNNVELDWEG